LFGGLFFPQIDAEKIADLGDLAWVDLDDCFSRRLTQKRSLILGDLAWVDLDDCLEDSFSR
jgi:hypothetical protein